MRIALVQPSVPDEGGRADRNAKQRAVYALRTPEWKAQRLSRARARRATPEGMMRSREGTKRWRATHPDRAKASMRKQCLARYGLTFESFNVLLETQNGLCAICRGSLGRGRVGSAVAVDHDHESGRVRGLLCNNCNRGIGMFADSPTALVAAAAYLRSRGTR